MAEPGRMDRARRRLLGMLGGLALGLCLPMRALARWVAKLRERTVERRDFSFDPAAGGRVLFKGKKPRPYALRLEGLVENPLALSYGELLALPRVEQVSDFHCVEGWSVKGLRWGGFRFGALMDLAGPKPRATHAVLHAMGRAARPSGGMTHYVECFSLAELRDPGREIILALELGGEPLPQAHGAPLRVIAPHEHGYKSIKYIERIELTDRPRPGWWSKAPGGASALAAAQGMVCAGPA